MIYILSQRLRSQKITTRKLNKILTDVIKNLTKKSLINLLFSTELEVGTFDFEMTRNLFHRICRSSGIKFSIKGIERLMNVIITVFKWQVMSSFCSVAKITSNHLSNLKTMLHTMDPERESSSMTSMVQPHTHISTQKLSEQDSDSSINYYSIGYIERKFSKYFTSFAYIDHFNLRYSLLCALQNIHTQVSALVSQNRQDEKTDELNFLTIPPDQPYGDFAEMPGPIRYYDMMGNEIDELQFDICASEKEFSVPMVEGQLGCDIHNRPDMHDDDSGSSGGSGGNDGLNARQFQKVSGRDSIGSENGNLANSRRFMKDRALSFSIAGPPPILRSPSPALFKSKEQTFNEMETIAKKLRLDMPKKFIATSSSRTSGQLTPQSPQQQLPSPQSSSAQQSEHRLLKPRNVSKSLVLPKKKSQKRTVSPQRSPSSSSSSTSSSSSSSSTSPSPTSSPMKIKKKSQSTKKVSSDKLLKELSGGSHTPVKKSVSYKASPAGRRRNTITNAQLPTPDTPNSNLRKSNITLTGDFGFQSDGRAVEMSPFEGLSSKKSEGKKQKKSSTKKGRTKDDVTAGKQQLASPSDSFASLAKSLDVKQGKDDKSVSDLASLLKSLDVKQARSDSPGDDLTSLLKSLEPKQIRSDSPSDDLNSLIKSLNPKQPKGYNTGDDFDSLMKSLDSKHGRSNSSNNDLTSLAKSLESRHSRSNSPNNDLTLLAKSLDVKQNKNEDSSIDDLALLAKSLDIKQNKNGGDDSIDDLALLAKSLDVKQSKNDDNESKPSNDYVSLTKLLEVSPAEVDSPDDEVASLVKSLNLDKSKSNDAKDLATQPVEKKVPKTVKSPSLAKVKQPKRSKSNTNFATPARSVSARIDFDSIQQNDLSALRKSLDPKHDLDFKTSSSYDIISPQQGPNSRKYPQKTSEITNVPVRSVSANIKVSKTPPNEVAVLAKRLNALENDSSTDDTRSSEPTSARDNRNSDDGGGSSGGGSSANGKGTISPQDAELSDSERASDELSAFAKTLESPRLQMSGPLKTSQRKKINSSSSSSTLTSSPVSSSSSSSLSLSPSAMSSSSSSSSPSSTSSSSSSSCSQSPKVTFQQRHHHHHHHHHHHGHHGHRHNHKKDLAT